MDLNVKQEQTQIQDVPVHFTKKTVPTRFGLLTTLLIAVIAGSGIWWYSFAYEEPEPIDVGQVVVQLQARRAVGENATTTASTTPVDSTRENIDEDNGTEEESVSS